VADTPQKRQIIDEKLRGAGLGAFGALFPDQQTAQAYIDAQQKETPEKFNAQQLRLEAFARSKGYVDANGNPDLSRISDKDWQELKREDKQAITIKNATGSGGNTQTPTLKPGTAAYRTAQDMAYGKLTFAQFRTLMAYNRDAGMKLALYDTARQINPNFNPAAFEMGYRYAGNPKTQNTLVSIDNALSNFDKAVDISNALDRTDFPTINKLLASGKFELGGKAVTNMQQFQTILGDDIALAIGQGAPSDYKTKLAQSLTNGNLSKENFISTLRQAGEFLQNRKRSILTQEGPYGTKEFNPSASVEAPAVLGGSKPKTREIKGGGTAYLWPDGQYHRTPPQ
jgi:hypothetical protein